ncbi:MAG: sulfurtransferase-like selenium metabolism protein YedF [Desulfovibrio sp.]|nr:sulfurtransferase-like selenium metabolism protein YedF [Desulfovibrio sp.]
MAQKELDCRGLACPEPVVRTRKLIETFRPAELNVTVDNAPACENVSRFLTRNGYSVSSAVVDDGLWVVTGKDTGASSVNEDDADFSACRPAAVGRTLVLITTQTLGRGDDALGEKLMGNFLASLPELGSSLWRVVLLNGGVKLSAKEGSALDSLKKLSESGVGVFVCGTCLDHYGLMEKKQVGETTNMLDIVTSLSLADKVIRP